ncbi:MAG: hypothetical protein A2748_03805 [Candidatus Wildermuthbacteria bacterium RIFCSPHIGHO2_01_FULL_45_20]|uniref:Bacterial spore germination immunoglobulin-like domain-containing protein n=1 Tax=Candidatus Wildermuthbacteria bacterium RIFCSPHIGHO2_02_FULL_45_25 TaxID=1802450 RepID=A0A1G2R1T6_9BACT|nr:MAG: hypothetical protein A2748_03805 [Candidatus Wildermuthbacteria bacterium RIFCSPHIGHO2_01_FULL_45_20]OHA66558.1 MAG: hypothetical protein A3C04_03940 [Candidatus Wildermuthbacteria bacterium RIFCSPHIGHO2_02_FULL_45_25]
MFRKHPWTILFLFALAALTVTTVLAGGGILPSTISRATAPMEVTMQDLQVEDGFGLSLDQEAKMPMGTLRVLGQKLPPPTDYTRFTVEPTEIYLKNWHTTPRQLMQPCGQPILGVSRSGASEPIQALTRQEAEKVAREFKTFTTKTHTSGGAVGYIGADIYSLDGEWLGNTCGDRRELPTTIAGNTVVRMVPYFWPSSSFQPGEYAHTLIVDGIGELEDIFVSSPRPNQIVPSSGEKFMVVGMVKGSGHWTIFEGTVGSVALYELTADGTRRALDSSLLFVAKGEPGSPISFATELGRIPTFSARGVLVFKNENPSGRLENDREFEVPVRFLGETITVTAVPVTPVPITVEPPILATVPPPIVALEETPTAAPTEKPARVEETPIPTATELPPTATATPEPVPTEPAPTADSPTLQSGANGPRPTPTPQPGSNPNHTGPNAPH